MQSFRRLAIVISCSGLFAGSLAGCSSSPSAPSSNHLREADVGQPRSTVPTPVAASASVPKPKASTKTETYSVVVNNVKAQELLFALARDAKVNVDIHPGIQGTVTLNAIDQTLQQLLTRISKQVDMRWELDGPNLSVMPDSPFLRTYKVDYVNLTRDASGTISASSQISTGLPGSGTGSSSNTTTGANANISSSRLENKISNRFWESLDKNLKDILRETDKLLPEGSSETIVERSDQQNTTGTGVVANAVGRTVRAATQQGIAGSPNPAQLQQDETTVTRRVTYREAASVIVNAESGIVTVRATGRQHEKVQEFIDKVTSSARRQVMIEATIVEVTLNDAYKQGIDWTKLGSNKGFSLSTPQTNNPASNTNPPFELKYINTGSLNISLTLNLLQQFGDAKVLSSPRLSVLNNQSALLKVVENYVYFTVKSDIATSNTLVGQPIVAFTTTPQSVSVGLVMAVTPQISENNVIILNVRPSITSVIGVVADPNPDLKTAGVTNNVPVIRAREMESILRVEDGEIAVLGGLMEEKTGYQTGRVPLLGAIPFLGEAFTSRDNSVSKSELVVFLRPVVIRDPSITGDYKGLRNSLPGQDFLATPTHAKPMGLDGTARPQP